MSAVLLTLIFHEFRDVEVTITMPIPYRESDGLTITTPDGELIGPRTVLMEIIDKHKSGWPQREFIRFHARMDVAHQRVNGVQPLAIEISRRRERAKIIHRSLRLRSMARLEMQEIRRKAKSNDSLVGQSQVIRGAETSSIVFDLSKVKIPDHCIFGSPLVSNRDCLRISHVEVVGIDNCLQSRVNFKYVIQSLQSSTW